MNTYLLLLALLLFATAEVKPLSVQIMGDRQPLTYDKEQEVTCQSTGAKTPVTITWSLDGTDLTHQSTMEEEVQLNVSRSILSIVPKKEHAGKVLTCKAQFTGHDRQPLEDSWTLELNYVLRSSPTGKPIPLTCTNPGKFPIPGYCQDYFQCQYIQGSAGLHPQIFLCPNGTIFDDSISDCWEDSLVTSPSECLSDGSISVQMADMISDTEGVCRRIKSIDRFETTVISTLPLRRSFDYAAKFNGYIMDYNQDLEVLKAHIGVWRKGNDIVSEIRRIYELAKKYENEFDRKYEINKDLLMTVPAKRNRQLSRLNEDITELKADIQNNKELLPEANTGGKTVLDARIASMESRVTEKESQIQHSSLVALELNERVTFLEFVSTDASVIVNKAAHSSRRTDELYRNILKATDTFREYAVNATSDMESLKTEHMQHEEELRNKQKEEANLENKKVELNNKESELTKAVEENSQKRRNMLDNLDKKKKIVCQPGGTIDLLMHIHESIRCDTLVKSEPPTYNGKDLYQQIDDSYETSKQLITEINKLLPQYEIINQNIETVRASIPAIEKRMKEIKVELREFEMFVPDVENMIQGINSALPDILDTKEGLQNVEATFRLVSEVLDKMVDRAKRADETERQNAKTYINKALSSLQNLIDQSSEKISEVESCSTLA